MPKRKKMRQQYTSKGERPCVSRKHKAREDRADPKNQWYANARALYAFLKGKKSYVTIPNPNPNETNKRFIRIPADHYFTSTKPFGMPNK